MKMKVMCLIAGLIPICTLALSLSSCNAMMKAMVTEKVKKLGVYDKSVAKDELATLLIPIFYTVNGFNGQDVKWKGTGWVTRASMIKIPAGSHTITYKYKYHSGGPTTKEEIRNNRRVMVTYYQPYVKDEFDHEMQMEFKAGTVYIIERKKLTSVTIPGSIKAIGDVPIVNRQDRKTLHIPQGTLDLYKSRRMENVFDIVEDVIIDTE